MAYSSSIKRAQTIKLCEICQEDSIKWSCKDCNMCLCEKCKTSHLKIPVTSQHRIVIIGTPLQDVRKKIVIDDIYIHCKDHPKEKTCLFCRSCDSLICQDCVSFSHKKHNFHSIKAALDEKLDYLRSIHDKIDDNLKCCESKTSEVQNTMPKFNAIFDESLTEIKQKEQELVYEIRKLSQHLQEKVEKDRSRVNNILLKIEKDIDNTKKNLKNQRSEIDSILTSSQGSIIFKATIMMKDQKFDVLPNQIEQYIPGTKSTKQIQKIFGSLQELHIPTTHGFPGMKLEVLRTFTTDLPYIGNVVACLDDTSAWISCSTNDGILRKINMKDNNMTTSQEVSLKVNGMTITSNDDIFLTMFKDFNMKLLKNSGEIVTFMTVAPLIPFGIHVTKDNDVIVGVKEPGNQYTPTDQSQRAVIVYGMDGKQKHRYQYDNDGKRLFTVPKTITTNSNKDILVIDLTSNNTGRVVAMNNDGILRWLYEGNSKINASQPFDPRGIVTTSVGHIIVSDYNSYALHVLSENGEVLICKVMRNAGVIGPWGLYTDNEEKLWLGCGSGAETGAKLHIIKLC